MKFRIQLGEQVLDYPAIRVHEFLDALCYCQEPAASPFYQFFVNDKEVPFEAAREAGHAILDAKLEKKLKTHKLVRVSVGATALPNTYRDVWIRK